MMEFVEYVVSKPWGEIPIAGHLSEEAKVFETCEVSHPDAGGPCGRPAVYEVYGLSFCQVHGLEANAAALAELYEAAAGELEGLSNPHAPPAHPEVERVLHASLETFREGMSRHRERHDRAEGEAFPFLEDRVHPDTRRWQPGGLEPSPGDEWSEELWTILRFMREARMSLLMETVAHLEPLRERVAAQAAYAQVDYGRKVAAYRAARGKSRKEE